MHTICSPVLVPHITGGAAPLGLVTLNWSVKHWVAVDTGNAPATSNTPKADKPTDVTEVLGPAMMKVLKSKRSWQTLGWHLQIFTRHWPISVPDDSKYVVFSLPMPPQVRLTETISMHYVNSIFCVMKVHTNAANAVAVSASTRWYPSFIGTFISKKKVSFRINQLFFLICIIFLRSVTRSILIVRRGAWMILKPYQVEWSDWKKWAYNTLKKSIGYEITYMLCPCPQCIPRKLQCQGFPIIFYVPSSLKIAVSTERFLSLKFWGEKLVFHISFWRYRSLVKERRQLWLWNGSFCSFSSFLWK